MLDVKSMPTDAPAALREYLVGWFIIQIKISWLEPGHLLVHTYALLGRMGRRVAAPAPPPPPPPTTPRTRTAPSR